MKPREVIIKKYGDGWYVSYVTRAKGQRYTAAQFSVRDHTQQDVINWIKKQPNLKLV